MFVRENMKTQVYLSKNLRYKNWRKQMIKVDRVKKRTLSILPTKCKQYGYFITTRR